MLPFGRSRWIGRAEWFVAITATGVILFFHYTYFRSAGALWRDEVDSVNVASMPSLGQLWGSLQFQSFPILWFLVLRGWIRWVGETDLAIRVLGLLLGAGVVGVLWRNARAFGQSTPIVALILLGFNATVLRFGDSVRGHGLGILTGLLAIGLIWEAAITPRPAQAALAGVATVAAVQSLYHNAVVVFAAVVAGLVIARRRGSKRSAIVMLGIGAVGAASLLPYLPMIRHRNAWADSFRISLDLNAIWSKIEEAFASTGVPVLDVWILLTAIALGLTLYSIFFIRGGGARDGDLDVSVYCGVIILVGIPAYILFLKAVGYPTQPWYYVPLLALVASCLEPALSRLFRSDPGRIARLGVLVLVVSLATTPIWKTARIRNTNMDLVASRLAALSAETDLIVTSPWYLGITFQRYFRKESPQTSVPPMPLSPVQRYDLLKRQMMSRDVMAPVLRQVEQTLRAGHRVFWVGDLFLPERGQAAPDPPPAPTAPWGWADSPYYYNWGLQAGYLVQQHATGAEKLQIAASQDVNEFEDANLYVFSGWWEHP